MTLDISQFGPSDYAAWWGAIIASLAFLWNIVVAICSGARVCVRVTPDIRVYPSGPPTYESDYVSVTAVNVGNGPTTITHCAGYYTKNVLGIFLKKHRQPFMINVNTATGGGIPFVLAPGTEWANLADQAFLLERAGKGRVYLGIIHNQAKSPVYKRVKFGGLNKDGNT